MRVPPISSAPEVLVRFGVAHIAALDADPETKSLVNPIRQATEKVRDIARKREAAREVATMKLALRERADFEADRLVRLLDAEAYLLASRDRSKSPYRDLFPDGVTPVVSAPLDQEIAKLQILESRVRNQGKVTQHADGLGAARTNLEGAGKAYVDAVRAEAEARGDLEIAKTDWERQYRTSYAALLHLFAGDRGRADSYFLAPARGRRGEDISPGPSPAPVTPAAPTPAPSAPSAPRPE